MMHIFFRYLIILISSTFILAGVVNTGSAGEFFVIPFWLIFIFAIRKVPNPKKITILILISSLYFPLKFDQERNSLIFPLLGSKLELIENWGYEIYYDDKNTKYLSPPSDVPRKIDRYTIETRDFSHKKSMTLIGIRTKHPSFSTMLYAILESEDGNIYYLYTQDIYDEINEGNIISPDLTGVQEHEYQSDLIWKFSMLAAWPILITLGIAKL